MFSSLVILSQLWLPTVQLVLQADWQVLLHSPQAVTFFSAGLAIVLIMIILLEVSLYGYYRIRRKKNQAISALFYVDGNYSRYYARDDTQKYFENKRPFYRKRAADYAEKDIG